MEGGTRRQGGSRRGEWKGKGPEGGRRGQKKAQRLEGERSKVDQLLVEIMEVRRIGKTLLTLAHSNPLSGC